MLQPEKLSEIQNEIRNMNPDFALVAAYSAIIPETILDIPHLGTFGIHPSLLPRHRGATPIQTAILEGDRETGVTIFKVDKYVDHGPIIAQKAFPIEENETYDSLEKKCAIKGAEAFLWVYPNLAFNTIETKPQDETKATLTKKFKTEDGFIPYAEIVEAQEKNKMLAQSIARKVRALGHEPGVWTIMENRRTKLLEITEKPDGLLHIKKIHIEGKKPQEI